MNDAASAPALPRFLLLLSLFYGGMVCIAGVVGNKQVALGPLAVEAGIFPFLMLVVLSSTVAEIYGCEEANRLVRWGFVPLVGSILLIALVLALPPAAGMDPQRREAFALVLGQSPRLMVAGIVVYGVSQTFNVTLFDALRRVEAGRMLWLRGALAGMASQAVDTLIFITLAFYGVFPIAGLLAGQMIAKVAISAVLLPPLITLLVTIERNWFRPTS